MEHKLNPPIAELPILKAECGLFGIQDNFFEDYLSLDQRFVKNKHSTFYFIASGESMSPLILAKDVLVVDRSIKPKSGQICVVALNGQMICKRYNTKGGQISLTSDNPKVPPVVVNEEMGMTLFGVVIAIARDVR